jgi:hypothetical protein
VSLRGEASATCFYFPQCGAPAGRVARRRRNKRMRTYAAGRDVHVQMNPLVASSSPFDFFPGHLRSDDRSTVSWMLVCYTRAFLHLSLRLSSEMDRFAVFRRRRQLAVHARMRVSCRVRCGRPAFRIPAGASSTATSTHVARTVYACRDYQSVPQCS